MRKMISNCASPTIINQFEMEILFRKNVTETKRIFICFWMFSHGKSKYARPWAWIGVFPVMNLEGVWVRNLVTTYGRASLTAKP